MILSTRKGDGTGVGPGYLISRIPLKARSVFGISAIRKRLGLYPSLTPLSYGTSLRYALGSMQSDHFYLLAFSREGILLEVYSKTSPLYLLGDALLRLLSVLALLEGLCSVELESLYPYMIWALGRQHLECVSEEPAEREEQGSDIVLAKRIIMLSREKSELGKKAERWHSAARQILARLIASRYGAGFAVDDVAHETGLSEETVREALRLMPTLGYKTLNMDGKTFSLVRL